MTTLVVPSHDTSLRAGQTVPTSIDDRRVQLTELMRTTGDVVLAICFHAVNDLEVARDLRQEIFVRAFEKLHQYRDEGPLRHWLLAMARKRALDAARWRKRWWRRFLSWEPKHETRDLAPPATEPQRDEDRLMRALAECLELLPDYQRMTILLRYQQGMSCPKIAELEKKNPGAVYERVARALPRLRKCIESKEVSL
jgi:RNA polymerase sigma-70 factor (ECF subfamily)